MNEWLKSLSLEDLKFLAPALFVFENEPEDAAIFMYKEGYAQPIAAAGDKDSFKKQSKQEIESRPPKKYWEQVKSEIFILLCTDNDKHTKLRKSLDDVYAKGSNIIVATIAASVASVMGVEAGVISGFCAVALHAVLKVGTEAHCSAKRMRTK